MQLTSRKLKAIEWVLTGRTSKSEAAFLLDLPYHTVCSLTRGHRSKVCRYTRLVPNRFGGEDLVSTDDPDLGHPYCD
jgi:hypothetical protein